MKQTILVILYLMWGLTIKGQTCYTPSTLEDYDKDFSELWIGRTFQGTIGNQNQRIEMRFLSIRKSSSEKGIYIVKGKSKVNQNICDFQGRIMITELSLLDSSDPDCEGPNFSLGKLSGSYELQEDATQKYVGVFEGKFHTMFAESNSNIIRHKGWLSDEGTNEFIGTWRQYDKKTAKYCAWGLQIPPSQGNNLFRRYDNEFYSFNQVYLDKGWKSYVISNLNSFTNIPENFDPSNPGYGKNFIKTYGKEEIESARKEEKQAWWE